MTFAWRAPRSWSGFVATALAVAVLVLAVVAPLGSMLAASFRVHEMVLSSGTVLRVAGSVTEEPLDPSLPDGEALLRFNAPSEADPDADTTPVALPSSAFVAREGRFVWSLANYRDVLTSGRTRGLLVHSFQLATGAALLALLLGIPVGWILSRTDLGGRGYWAALLAGPLLLPPFFAAMGTSSGVGKATEWLGLSGGALQLGNSMICFASILFPIPAALVGRALASVPAGVAEAARLMGGEAAVRRHAVWPAVLPAVLASFGLVVVMSLCDFAVPDLLGVFLPTGSVPIHVFATEIFFQWSKSGGNVGRSVATGAPFVLVVVALLVLVARALRRCPEGMLSHSFRERTLVRLSKRGRVGAVAWLAFAFGLGLALPIASVCSWGFSPTRIPATIRETPALLPDALRWLRLSLLSATLVTAMAVVLARASLRGPRAVGRTLAPASLSTLAVPGMALMVATLLLWRSIPAAPGTLWKGVLILTARFLPYAFVAVWLVLRQVDRGLEDAARTLGAGASERARRIWLPLSVRGIAGAFVLALVLALRETDSLVLVESGILPVRIYDKVHFGRTGQVADLSMAYLGLLVIPALLAVALLRRRPKDRGGEPHGGCLRVCE